MRRIIHNIRKQPEETRRHILHVATFVFAVILVFLWLYSLGANLTSRDTRNKLSEDLKPFSALTNNIIDGYDSLSDPSLDIQE